MKNIFADGYDSESDLRAISGFHFDGRGLVPAKEIGVPPTPICIDVEIICD